MLKSFIAVSALCFATAQVNAQMASDAPASANSAKAPAAAKVVTTPAVQTASSPSAAKAEVKATTPSASSSKAATPVTASSAAGVSFGTDAAKAATPSAATVSAPVVSDQGGVKPLLSSDYSAKTAPVKIEAGPVETEKVKEVPKADPGNTDSKPVEAKKNN